jgi:hypothetical protein
VWFQSVLTNLIADILWALAGAMGAYIVWPRFRRRIDRWVEAHFHKYHEDRASPSHEALHQRLDELSNTIFEAFGLRDHPEDANGARTLATPELAEAGDVEVDDEE